MSRHRNPCSYFPMSFPSASHSNLCLGNSSPCCPFFLEPQFSCCKKKKLCFVPFKKKDSGFAPSKLHYSPIYKSPIAFPHRMLHWWLMQPLALNLRAWSGVQASLLSVESSHKNAVTLAHYPREWGYLLSHPHPFYQS